MRLTKAQLDRILIDATYFWTLRDQWRDTDHVIDIDKAWHAIHYIFSKCTWGGPTPEKWIIFGDVPIPKLDGGVGPACYLNPSQVSQINDLLQKVSDEEFKKLYDPRKLDKAYIYPHIWYRDKGNGQEFEFVLFHYKQLRNLYQKAAESREYVVMVIG